MATSLCQLAEDQCTVCFEVFTDPVTLPCGHNFCKNCIEEKWSIATNCSCPCCYIVFDSRPVLIVKPLTAEMAVEFNHNKARSSSVKQEAKPGEVPCDECPKPKLKAVKSCLVCLASYCDTHLQPHLTISGLKRHKLVDPQENLEERLCKDHNKLFELYCKDDKCCVCLLCSYSGHKGHEIVPLEKATEKQKLQLKKTENEIQLMISSGEMKIQELQRCMDQSKTNADREIAESVKVLTALSELLEKCYTNLIQSITKKNFDIQEKAKLYIKTLERGISNLQTRSAEVKQCLKSDDDLHLLQNFQQMSSSPYIKDWDNLHLTPPTYKGTVVKALSQLEEDFIKTTMNLFEAELERAKAHNVEVTLDSDPHPQLTVSRNQREVAHSPEKRVVRDNTRRFDSPFVLGNQSFSKTFYFEATVRKKTEWTLGVANKSDSSITTLHPQKCFWTIALRNQTYYATENKEIFLSTRCKPDKVGVFVDYEDGLVSFYDVEAGARIYSFSDNNIPGSLCPICSPGGYRSNNSAPIIFGMPSHSMSFNLPQVRTHKKKTDI